MAQLFGHVEDPIMIQVKAEPQHLPQWLLDANLTQIDFQVVGGTIVHTRGNVRPGVPGDISVTLYPFLAGMDSLPPRVGAAADDGDPIPLFRMDIETFQYRLMDADVPAWLWAEPRKMR